MPLKVVGRQARKQVASFGVSDDEMEFIRQQAKAAGLRLGPYLRQVCLGIRVEPLPPTPAHVDQEAMDQLRGIGTNLNQALRRINEGTGKTSDWDTIRDSSRAVFQLKRLLIGHDPNESFSDRRAGIPTEVVEVIEKEKTDINPVKLGKEPTEKPRPKRGMFE